MCQGVFTPISLDCRHHIDSELVANRRELEAIIDACNLDSNEPRFGERGGRARDGCNGPGVELMSFLVESHQQLFFVLCFDDGRLFMDLDKFGWVVKGVDDRLVLE